MFVSEYRTFVTPSSSTPQTKKSFTYTKKSDFALPLQKTVSLLSQPRSTFPNFIQNQNYFANKKRFSYQSDTPEALQRLQQLAKTNKVEEAYQAVHVSFMDLTKPKKALSPERFTFSNLLDEKYKQLALTNAKAVTSKIYIANDLYYRQAYAS